MKNENERTSAQNKPGREPNKQNPQKQAPGQFEKSPQRDERQDR